MEKEPRTWGRLVGEHMTVPDSLAQRLERMILSGELVEGDRLPPEREFSATLGVSRNTLREALRVLELRGLLERKQGSGTHVRKVADSKHATSLAASLDEEVLSLVQVMELRACIEPPVAAFAAQRANPADIDQLHQLIEEMKLVSRPQMFADLDRLFHRSIAQYTHNPMLLRLLDKITEVIEVSRQELFLSESRQASSLREHIAIFEAIKARDADAAFSAAHAHVESIQNRLVSSLTVDGGAAEAS